MTETTRASWSQVLIAVLAAATALAIFGTSTVSLYVAIDTKGDLKEDIQQIHILINSRMDELLVEARKNARAEGVIEGESN